MAAFDAFPAEGDGVHRRELERVAFGPDSTDAERRDARDALVRLTSPAPPISRSVAGEHGAWQVPAVRTAGREAPNRRRRARPVLLAAGALGIVLAGAVLIPPLLEPSSFQVFDRAQTDADRDVPLWVSNAVAAGASASGRAGAGADLFASLRALPVAGGPAYAFTDGVDVCLAVLRSVECVDRETFAVDGLQLVAVDPSEAPELSRLLSWGPRGRLRSEALPSGRAGDEESTGRAAQVIACMADHGHEARVDGRGRVVAGIRSDPRGLDFEMARLDCVVRFPR